MTIVTAITWMILVQGSPARFTGICFRDSGQHLKDAICSLELRESAKPVTSCDFKVVKSWTSEEGQQVPELKCEMKAGRAVYSFFKTKQESTEQP